MPTSLSNGKIAYATRWKNPLGVGFWKSAGDNILKTLLLGYGGSPRVSNYNVASSPFTSIADASGVGSGTIFDGDYHPSGLLIFTNNTATAADRINAYLFDGTSFTRLAAPPSFQNQPIGVSIHPSGNYVAISGTGTANVYLWKITLSGTTLTWELLYDNLVGNAGVAFSPDGTALAYGFTTTLRLQSFDETTGLLGTNNDYGVGQFFNDCDWHPSSEYIAVTNSNDTPRFRIYKRTLPGIALTNLSIPTWFPNSVKPAPNGPGGLRWNKKGTNIFIGRSSTPAIGMYSFDTATDTATDITSNIDTQPTGGNGNSADWTPDDTTLIVATSDPIETFRKYSVSGNTYTRENAINLANSEGFLAKQTNYNGEWTAIPNPPYLDFEWDSGVKGSNITLSGSDLIATYSGPLTYQSVAANKARSTGKYFFGVASDATIDKMIGLMGASTLNVNTYVGAVNNGVSWLSGGSIFVNDVSVTSGQGSYLSSRGWVGVDLDNQLIYFVKADGSLITYGAVDYSALGYMGNLVPVVSMRRTGANFTLETYPMVNVPGYFVSNGFLPWDDDS